MKFGDVIGQEQVKRSLIKVYADNHLSHAQLFLGQEGSGNLALAIAFAQYIFCSDKQSNDSCGNCPDCRKFAKLEHPDFHFSFPIILKTDDKACDPHLQDFRNAVLQQPYLTYKQWVSLLEDENKKAIIGTKQSDEIIEKLVLKSFQGREKILVIWMPEMMNDQAANKLLKTLEEPPENTYVFMVANNQQGLLPTIISRTQVVPVPLLSESDIIRGLMEKEGASESEAKRAAGFADGNYGVALDHLYLKEEDLDFFKLFREWMRFCVKKNFPGIIKHADDFSSLGREKQKSFLIYCLQIFRQGVKLTYVGEQSINIAGEEREFLRNFSPYLSPHLVDLSEQVNESIYHLERNANAKILFFDLSIIIARALIRSSNSIKTKRA